MRQHSTEGGPIVFYLHFIGVGRGTGGFNLQAFFYLFVNVKMFYPQKGCLFADSFKGPIGFTYVLFLVSKSLEAFKFTGGFFGKKIFENVLSSEGTSACRLLQGSNWFYLCFIPRKDSAKQIPKEVQMLLLMSYFVLRRVYWIFN